MKEKGTTTRNKVTLFADVDRGDLIECTNCGKRMLVPYGLDTCPLYHSTGTNMWVDDEHQEATAEYVREHYNERAGGYHLRLSWGWIWQGNFIQPTTAIIIGIISHNKKITAPTYHKLVRPYYTH